MVDALAIAAAAALDSRPPRRAAPLADLDDEASLLCRRPERVIDAVERHGCTASTLAAALANACVEPYIATSAPAT